MLVSTVHGSSDESAVNRQHDRAVIGERVRLYLATSAFLSASVTCYLLRLWRWPSQLRSLRRASRQVDLAQHSRSRHAASF
jgi:hypothetical protein